MYLVQLASEKKWKKVIELARRGIDVNAFNNGMTALSTAAYYGEVEVIKALIAANADVNLQRNDQCTALFLAAQNGHVTAVVTLIKAKADVNIPRKFDFTPVFIASQNGHVEMVKTLIKAGADVNFVRYDGCSPVFIASQNGHLQIVDALVGAKADVNLANKYGYTPVYIAAQNGHLEVVDRLIKAKAVVNKQKYDGWSPLFIASDNNRVEVMKSLMKAGADINIQTNDGYTPTFIAARHGHLQALNELIKANADVNLCSNEGVTPLLVAVYTSQTSAVQLLLANNADVLLASKTGMTQLQAACCYGNKQIAVLMMQHMRQHQLDVSKCLSSECATLAIDCMRSLSTDSKGVAVTQSTALSTPQVSETEFSNQLHAAMLQAGFHSRRSALQSAVADILQHIQRNIRDDDRIFVVGSFSEGWGNSLISLCGKTDLDSDIDVTIFVPGRLYHLSGRCECNEPDDAIMVEYENGHVMSPGSTYHPSKCFTGTPLRPAYDIVRVYKCCCYPNIEVLHTPGRRTHLPRQVMDSLQQVLSRPASPCHLVTAAPPGQAGKQLRVSTTFLERCLMRSLTDVQGQLFILLKYLIKKVICGVDFQVKGLKTYHAKCLLFYMLDEIPSEQWQPCELLRLTRKALEKLLLNLKQENTLSNECMRHFFMRDAIVYLKSGHSTKEEIAQAVTRIMEKLPELLTAFKDQLKISHGKTFLFYYHPFLSLPLIFEKQQKVTAQELMYHDIYDVVRDAVEKLSKTDLFDVKSLIASIDRLPDCAYSARESLRAMACLKIKADQGAKEVLRNTIAHSVSRGIDCPIDSSTDPATVMCVKHLKESDSAWKFCFLFDDRPEFNFLPEFIRNTFPTRLQNYRNHFFVNFDALRKCLCLELIGSEVSEQTWFSEVLHNEDADVQELMMALHYWRDKEQLVTLIHSHRAAIAEDEDTVNKVSSLLGVWAELREASAKALLEELKRKYE